MTTRELNIEISKEELKKLIMELTKEERQELLAMWKEWKENNTKSEYLATFNMKGKGY